MARKSRRRMSYTTRRRMPARGRKGRFSKASPRSSYAKKSSGSTRSGFITPSLLVVGLLIGGGVMWMRKRQADTAMRNILAAQAQANVARGAPFPTQTSVPAMIAPATTSFIQSAMNLFKPVP